MEMWKKKQFHLIKNIMHFFRYYSTYPPSSFKIKLKGQIYDFRSDTVTRPTDEMFDVMRNASRGDDVFDVNE